MRPRRKPVIFRKAAWRRSILPLVVPLALMMPAANAANGGAGIAGPADSAASSSRSPASRDLDGASVPLSSEDDQPHDADQAPVLTYPAEKHRRAKPSPEEDSEAAAAGQGRGGRHRTRPKSPENTRPPVSLESVRSDLNKAVRHVRRSAKILAQIAQTGNEGRVRIDIASSADVVAAAARRAASAASEAGKANNVARAERRAEEASKAAQRASNAADGAPAGNARLSADSRRALKAIRAAADDARRAARAAGRVAAALASHVKTEASSRTEKP